MGPYFNADEGNPASQFVGFLDPQAGIDWLSVMPSDFDLPLDQAMDVELDPRLDPNPVNMRKCRDPPFNSIVTPETRQVATLGSIYMRQEMGEPSQGRSLANEPGSPSADSASDSSLNGPWSEPGRHMRGKAMLGPRMSSLPPSSITVRSESEHDKQPLCLQEAHEATVENAGRFSNSYPIRLEAPNRLPTSPSSSVSSACNTAVWIQKLLEINVQLYQHVASIPSIRGEGFEAVAAINTHPSSETWIGKGAGIDGTFCLSQQLIEILDHLSPSALSDSSSYSFLQFTPRPCPMDPSAVQSPGLISLDQASILLVLSSYLRLIEAYDRILSNMQNTLIEARTQAASAIATTSDQQSILLPRLIIGSFEPSATSVLRVSLIINVAETLLSRIRTLLRSMKSVYFDYENSGDSSKDMTLRAIRVKERRIMKTIYSIRKSYSQ